MKKNKQKERRKERQKRNNGRNIEKKKKRQKEKEDRTEAGSHQSIKDRKRKYVTGNKKIQQTKRKTSIMYRTKLKNTFTIL